MNLLVSEICKSQSGAKKVLKRHDFDKTSFNDFVSEQSDFLRLVGERNESLRIFIIYYIYVQILIWEKNKFARVTSETKKTSYNEFV